MTLLYFPLRTDKEYLLNEKAYGSFILAQYLNYSYLIWPIKIYQLEVSIEKILEFYHQEPF